MRPETFITSSYRYRLSLPVALPELRAFNPFDLREVECAAIDDVENKPSLSVALMTSGSHIGEWATACEITAVILIWRSTLFFLDGRHPSDVVS